MKRELEQLKSRLEVRKWLWKIFYKRRGYKTTCLLICVGICLQEESQKVRAETKLDINLENSRISDMVGRCVCVWVFISNKS